MTNFTHTLRKSNPLTELSLPTIAKRGCKAIGMNHTTNSSSAVAANARVVYDILGDDMDGAMAEFAD